MPSKPKPHKPPPTLEQLAARTYRRLGIVDRVKHMGSHEDPILAALLEAALIEQEYAWRAAARFLMGKILPDELAELERRMDPAFRLGHDEVA